MAVLLKFKIQKQRMNNSFLHIEFCLMEGSIPYNNYSSRMLGFLLQKKICDHTKLFYDSVLFVTIVLGQIQLVLKRLVIAK